LPADEVTQGDIPLGLMQTSLRSRLSRMSHVRHIKDERKEIRLESYSPECSSHQAMDAASTPTTILDFQRPRANTESLNMQHARAEQNKLCFMPKGIQPSQACSGEHIAPNRATTAGKMKKKKPKSA
jgi:hypothetical protein